MLQCSLSFQTWIQYEKMARLGLLADDAVLLLGEDQRRKLPYGHAYRPLRHEGRRNPLYHRWNQRAQRHQ